MINMGYRAYLLQFVGLVLFLTSAQVALGSETRFDKVLVFAGADNVRLQFRIQSDSTLNNIELDARISQGTEGAPLWEGKLPKLSVVANSTGTGEAKIGGLKPQLWSPASPTLY